jgi:large subunit ribosomal protein L27
MASRLVRFSTSTTLNAPSSSCLSALERLSLGSPTERRTSSYCQVRYASHASQGRANKAAQGPGKRLGAKKSDSELVVPGNIIFKQRGTHWFPGENCDMGRDHTIFATAKGFVRFYKDPDRHKDRKYIGVVFRQEESLPRGRNAARRRRVGMEAVQSEVEESNVGQTPGGEMLEGEVSHSLLANVESTAPTPKSLMTLRAGYQFRESNTSIGRTAERANVQVRPYNSKDRFLAWRKAQARRAKNAERRSIRRN